MKILTLNAGSSSLKFSLFEGEGETVLAEGVRFERRLFHTTFALDDQKEGMAAFLEKRPPNFTNG